MKKFAQLDNNNYVINLLQVDDLDAPTEEAGKIFISNLTKTEAANWVESVETAYSTTAHIGAKWYPDEGYFKGDPLYPSWVFNEEMWIYTAPVAYPDGEPEGKYMWDEPSVSWVLDPSYSE